MLQIRAIRAAVLVLGLCFVGYGQIVNSGGSSGGGGGGTVTSVTIAGTANQITATGTCTGTATITCTLSIPSAFVLPGTIDGLTITTTTGTLTVVNGKTLTVNKTLTLDGTDGVTLTFPSTSATIARTDAGQTFTGTQVMTATLGSTSTATTQTAADNSTKLATTAYVDTALGTKVLSFTPVVSGNWSALGSGGAIASITGAQGGTGMQVTGTNNSATNWAGAQIAVAGTSWTKTFAVYMLRDDISVSPSALPGFLIGFTDGTKVEGAYLVGNGGGAGTFVIAAASTTNVAGGTVANAGGTTGNYPLISNPVWIQCTRATSTYSCSFSPDGVNYQSIFSESAPFLTATGVAVVGGTRRADATAAPILLVESFN